MPELARALQVERDVIASPASLSRVLANPWGLASVELGSGLTKRGRPGAETGMACKLVAELKPA